MKVPQHLGGNSLRADHGYFLLDQTDDIVFLGNIHLQG